jgi:hypothetical protein
MPRRFKITPITQKDKNRIREHGVIWTEHGQSITNTQKILLEADDGYWKWWPISQLEEVDDKAETV